MHLLWYSLPLVCTPIGRHSLWYPLPVSLTLAFPPLLLRFQPLFLALSHSLSLSSASPADARQINVRAIVTWAPCPIVTRAPTPLLPRVLTLFLPRSLSHALSPQCSLRAKWRTLKEGHRCSKLCNKLLLAVCSPISRSSHTRHTGLPIQTRAKRAVGVRGLSHTHTPM